MTSNWEYNKRLFEEYKKKNLSLFAEDFTLAEYRHYESVMEARERLDELFREQDEIYNKARKLAIEQRLTNRQILCNESEMYECTICQTINTKETSSVLPCKHYFHIKCVSEWLVVKPECPNCRKSTSR